MSSVHDPEPEDFGLDSAQLRAQNQAVLSAKENLTREEEDEKALDDIARVWKGRPIPEDWDPDDHPYFMSQEKAKELVSKGGGEGDPFVDGIRQLLVDDPPEVQAEELKGKGNAALKRGPKYFSDAIKLYTDALAVGSPDAAQNSVIYANRAAVQLLKKNYGKVVEDCEEAIKLNGDNAKAYYRAAKACCSLQKWQKAIDFATAGLEKDPENKEMAKELEAGRQGLKKREEEARAKKAAEARKLVDEGSKGRALRRACDDRGVVLGEEVYKDMVGQGGKAEAYVDAEGTVHWPVLLLYGEFDQSDFLADVAEGACVGDLLGVILDPAQPRPDWDTESKYVAGKVNAYYATHQCKPLEGGKKKANANSDESFISSILSGSDRKGAEEELARAAKSEWRKVDLDMPLHRVLQEEDHVVPGLPVFHIVVEGSFFERHLLSTAPDRI